MTSKDLTNTPFLQACRCEPADHVPVWFMRQAGRSLPEYRALRKEGSILDAIKKPDVSAEITMQPIRRYGVDAAILYSDIIVPIHAVGFGVDIQPGVGPVTENPFRSTGDLQRLRELDPIQDTPYVLETIKICVEQLDIPLIGFAGGPFTIASYLIEGGPSRTYQETKRLMFENPELWAKLMDRLTQICTSSLLSQIDAGVSAVQLFDSWVGALSPSQYIRFVFPWVEKMFKEISSTGVPKIHFGVVTGELLQLMSEVGADVVGVDWRVPLDLARDRIGGEKALQGNLDPAILGAPWPVIQDEVLTILKLNDGHPGHIFNLGHGVTPNVNPEVLERIVQLVHQFRVNQ
ncbi:MAG: uroporphyrinogen decarboxylase [Acidimicrobiales bacterium]|nr:uroporphyrinogen decarboxylase [Acidimicrobiales bacterium]MDG1846872.1 uroporphyrinogen decarboxylase [Acidimicrobiales bacterium]